MAMLNTVLGPIDASEIGDTMSHVHLTIDLLCWHMPPESGPPSTGGGWQIMMLMNVARLAPLSPPAPAPPAAPPKSEAGGAPQM